MNWGSLNPALFSFRNSINALLPNRSTKSDGGIANGNHSSTSQHQKDKDGWTDAFDCDNNFLNSNVPNGNTQERQILEALKLDFEDDPRAHLWISHREIANHAVDDWREREYKGESPHDEHTHFESHEQNQNDGRPWNLRRTKALLEEYGMGNAHVVSFSPAALKEIKDEVIQGVLNYGAIGPDGVEEGGVTDLPGQEASNVLGVIDRTYNTTVDGNKKIEELHQRISDIETTVEASRADITTILHILTNTVPETK